MRGVERQKKGAGEALQDLAHKAADKGRDTLDQAVLKRRLDKLYRQLGAMVANQHGQGGYDADEIEFFVREIDRLRALLPRPDAPKGEVLRVEQWPFEKKPAKPRGWLVAGAVRNYPQKKAFVWQNFNAGGGEPAAQTGDKTQGPGKNP